MRRRPAAQCECNGSAISPIGLRTGKEAKLLQYALLSKYKSLAPFFVHSD